MKIKVTGKELLRVFGNNLIEKDRDFLLEGEPVKDECGCTCHTTRPWLEKEGKCECEKEPVNEHEELCSYKGKDAPCGCLKEPKKVIEEIGVSFTMVTLRDKTNELVKAFNNLKI